MTILYLNPVLASIPTMLAFDIEGWKSAGTATAAADARFIVRSDDLNVSATVEEIPFFDLTESRAQV